MVLDHSTLGKQIRPNFFAFDKGPSTYSLFPRLTSTGRLGGKGVRQWTLVRGIFGEKQTDARSSM